MIKLLTALRGWSVAASFCLLVGLSALLHWAPAWRLDLTEEKLYTLGDGSRGLVDQLQQPVTLSLYFSATLADKLPQLKDYAQRIEDLLKEYQALNPDKIIVRVIDPEPFSDAEDSATLAGLQGAPVTLGGDSLYLGLIAQTEGRDSEIVAFFNPERERFLEYDISQLIHRLGQAKPPTIGVISGVQLFGGYDFASQRSTGPWAVIEQLGDVAEVEQLHAPLSKIDASVDILMVVHPKELDQPTLYAIDQFVLGGGRAMIFVDPNLEASAAAQGQINSSELEPLLSAWGVQYRVDEIVGDRNWGLRISTSNQGPALPHVGIIGLPSEGMDQDSIITTELDSINVASAGRLQPVEGREMSFQPLLMTSTDAMVIDSATYNATRDHGELLLDFASADEVFVLAAQLSGESASAFEHAPAQDDIALADADEQEGDHAPAPQALAPHRAAGPINVIVVADVDVLSDRLWVQVSNFFGQQVMVPWANNGDFVMNAVENLGGSEALISLRSRGQYARPFEVVNRLRAQAAEEFKQQEQELLLRLEGLEERISNLTPAMDGQGQAVMSDEQAAEVEAFEVERLETRKQLRQVQHQLNQSIDALETRLRWLNMGLMPALLALLMVAMLFYRRRRSGL